MRTNRALLALGAPEVKQPYIQIEQWQGGRLVPVRGAGPNKDGWVPVC
jgi:hypothetical protein